MIEMSNAANSGHNGDLASPLLSMPNAAPRPWVVDDPLD
jgi:hypothetical protein